MKSAGALGLLLAGVQMLTPVSAEPFSCSELGIFAAEIARFRDIGTSLDTARQAVIDGEFTAADERDFIEIVDSIYSAQNIPPEVMHDIAVHTCSRARRENKRE